MISAVKLRMIILLAAFILDLLLGDPRGLPHLVVFMGKLTGLIEEGLRRVFKPGEGQEEDKGLKFFIGTVLFLAVTALSVLIPCLILYLAGRIDKYLKLTISVFICFQLLAAKSLFTETMKVYRALKAGDVAGARIYVSMIVGRDTESLDEEGIVRAAVETVAENTSDGVIAPMFYMVILGIPGMLFYKAVNTLDSMVGYKNERYLYLGRFSARMDDLLNLIPARISGLLLVWAGGLNGYDAKEAMRIFLRDRKNHSSPNSAHTEAAMAGALGIRLGGNARYFGKLYEKPFIGEGKKPAEADDIRNACKIMLTTSVLALLISMLALLIVSSI